MVFISNLFNTPDGFYVCKTLHKHYKSSYFFLFASPLKENVSVYRIFLLFSSVVVFFFRWPETLVKAINLTATGADFAFNMQPRKSTQLQNSLAAYIFFTQLLFNDERKFTSV